MLNALHEQREVVPQLVPHHEPLRPAVRRVVDDVAAVVLRLAPGPAQAHRVAAGAADRRRRDRWPRPARTTAVAQSVRSGPTPIACARNAGVGGGDDLVLARSALRDPPPRSRPAGRTSRCDAADLPGGHPDIDGVDPDHRRVAGHHAVDPHVDVRRLPVVLAGGTIAVTSPSASTVATSGLVLW